MDVNIWSLCIFLNFMGFTGIVRYAYTCYEVFVVQSNDLPMDRIYGGVLLFRTSVSQEID